MTSRAAQPHERVRTIDDVRNAPLHIALVEPEIPPNTGNVARLCAATGCALHLVEPLGFRIDDRELKRAGLDYWHNLGVVLHPSLDAFLASTASMQRWYFSTHAQRRYSDAPFALGDILVFGRETKGLPKALIASEPDRALRIPMREESVAQRQSFYGRGYRNVRRTSDTRISGAALMPKLTHTLINDVFRGPVYGQHDIFTARSFAEFVRRHDIDLSRALFTYDGKRVIGTIAFAQRGKRAWLSLMGVLPDYRRRGLGRELFGGAVDAVRASGAKHIEFEVVQTNAHARKMYEGFGFKTVGELYVWARKARDVATNGLTPRKHSLRTVERVAFGPRPRVGSASRSQSRARPHRTLIEVEGAYAFVLTRKNIAVLLDAGADDERSAFALLHELDARVPYDITFLNEPSNSPLTTALQAAGWRIVERQFQMTD